MGKKKKKKKQNYEPIANPVNPSLDDISTFGENEPATVVAEQTIFEPEVLEPATPEPKPIVFEPTTTEPTAVEWPVEEPVNEKSSNHGLRVFAVVMALIVTILIAVFAGAALALVDLEKKPADLIAGINGSDVEVAVAAAKEEYEAIFAAASAKVTADLDTAGSVIVEGQNETEDENATDAGESDADNSAAGNSDVSDADATDADNSDADAKLASSEIAGIGEVVSAGTNDIIVYKPAADGEVAHTSVISDPNANYPLPYSTVDLSYFDDALFIGDSRMQGFGMYSGLTNATFYAIQSFSIFKYQTMPVVQTPSGKVPIFTALPYDQFTKIYIKVGLNELGGSDETFLQTYDELITKLREMEPRAIIYTHAILPVTAAKSASDRTHCNENIQRRNAALKQYAEEHQCYYIDVAPVVSIEDGSLMPEMAGDGIHLKAGYMELWKEYLRTHAVIF